MIDNYESLPERIRSALAEAGLKPDSFRLALKTTYKPNATIPRLWIVLGIGQVVICNTHKTRGVWKVFQGSGSLTLSKTSTGEPYYEVMGPEGKRHFLTLPSSTDLEAFEAARLSRK